jgi:hypothetical protein
MFSEVQRCQRHYSATAPGTPAAHADLQRQIGSVTFRETQLRWRRHLERLDKQLAVIRSMEPEIKTYASIS